MRRGAGSDGRDGAARRAAVSRTAKPRGPDPPTLGSSRASNCEATEANKPGLWGERGVSRKAIAQRRPVVSAHLYCLVGVFLSAHEACGCGQRPVFPAPSGFRGDTEQASPERIGAAGTRTFGHLTSKASAISDHLAPRAGRGEERSCRFPVVTPCYRGCKSQRRDSCRKPHEDGHRTDSFGVIALSCESVRGAAYGK